MAIQSTVRDTDSQAETPTAGVLLIHGLYGSLRDMAEIEIVLRKHKLVTRNLLLPGHGGRMREVFAQGWTEWAAEVRAAYRDMRKQCERVFLVGHSLGGALALHTAAHEEVAGVVSMCAPLYLHLWTRPLVVATKYLLPWVPPLRENNRAATSCPCDVRRPPASHLESMMNYLPILRDELQCIQAPALIMVSRRDQMVPARNGREIYRRIGSREKHLVTFYHSYHVIMRDHDREEVFAKTEAFILRHAHHIQRNPF